MRVYDVALVVVRTTAAVELVHAAVEVGYTGVRFVFLMESGARDSAWLTRVELSTWMLPIEMAAFGVLLLLASRPIARFAARFASHTDTAR